MFGLFRRKLATEVIRDRAFGLLGELLFRSQEEGWDFDKFVSAAYMGFTKNSVFATADFDQIKGDDNVICWIKLTDVPELGHVRHPVAGPIPSVPMELHDGATIIAAMLTEGAARPQSSKINKPPQDCVRETGIATLRILKWQIEEAAKLVGQAAVDRILQRIDFKGYVCGFMTSFFEHEGDANTRREARDSLVSVMLGGIFCPDIELGGQVLEETKFHKAKHSILFGEGETIGLRDGKAFFRNRKQAVMGLTVRLIEEVRLADPNFRPSPERYASGEERLFKDSQFRAEVLGDPRAQFNLGQCFRRGTGTEKSPADAARWFAKAAEQGHKEAMTNLGQQLLDGDGIEKDEKSAAVVFSRAAELGDALAQYTLGSMYESGRAVRRDLVAARNLYIDAAREGVWMAAFRLGRLHALEDSPLYDLGVAVKWLGMAAKGGHPAAQFTYGLMLFHGHGTTKAEEKGYFWIYLSAAAGHKPASETAREIEGLLSPAKIAFVREEAASWIPEERYQSPIE